jgi:SAM-dependent methyltransferase
VSDRLEALRELAAVPDAEYVRRLYRLALRRDPDDEALARSVEKLSEGTLSRAALLAELVASDEFERVRVLDDAVAFAAWARAADERPRGLQGPPATGERVIEIPWTLARYRGESRVLDVGFVFAEPEWQAALTAAVPGEVVGVDLAEGVVPGYRGVVADVRSLPLDDGALDVAFCISTLEHVGRDNRRYGLAAEDDPDGMTAALRELRRVLGRGGRLLLTVPCGDREELDWLVQLGEREWLDLFEASGFLVFEHELYELDADGWRAVAALGAGLGYGSRGPAAAAVLCAELRPTGPVARIRDRVRRLRGHVPEGQSSSE